MSPLRFARIQSVAGWETLAKVLAWRLHECRILPMHIKAPLLVVPVHCGSLFHLLLLLWAELAAGRVIPTDLTEMLQDDMQSLLSSLQGALKQYNRSLSAVSVQSP